MTARDIALRSASVVMLLLLSAPAQAQEPADLTPLGIPDPSYSCPFGGYYLVRYPGTPTDGTTFNIVTGPEPVPPPTPNPGRFFQTWGVPPEAKDKKAAGNAVITAMPWPSPNWQGGFWWNRLQGTAPGWVKLEVRKFGVLVAVAYYRFYKIHIIEDDQGDTSGCKGFDPRYGAASLGLTFNECGGPYDRGKPANEPPAEDIQGYDGRFEGGAAWSGEPAPIGPLRSIPEAMVTGNSLMFNMRNPQNIRIFLQGPREPFCPPVPVLLRCTEHGTGSIGGVEIGGNFTPHDPIDPVIGFCTIPGSWDGPIRQLLVEQPPEAGNGNGDWMLRWAPEGTHESSYKGDIEIEAKIPNPSQLWKLYGAGALGDFEGVMHGRLGTVYTYADYAVWPSEPSDLSLLRTFWVRRVCHKFENQPAVGTPDEATHGFGAKLTAGERSDALYMVTADQLDGSAIALDDWSDNYMDEEVWVLKTNHKMAGVTDPSPEVGDDGVFYCFWTKADVPPDVAEPWSTNPDSIEMEYRSYIGAVDVDVPGIIQFDAEPEETGAQEDVPQHFINAVADVNDDGLITNADDGDSVEEQDPTGLLINTYPEAAKVGSISHKNLRPIKIKLSKLPQGMTGGRGGFSIVVTTQYSELSKLSFWKDAAGTEAMPLIDIADGVKGWAASLSSVENDEMTIYVGADVTAQPGGVMTIAIARDPDPQGHGPSYQRIHFDKIRYTTYRFGLDVDSNNDGTVGNQDDHCEEDTPAFVFENRAYQIRVRQHPYLSSFSSPVVQMKTSAAGRVTVTPAGGGTALLPPAPTSQDTYTFNNGTIQGGGFLYYEMGVGDPANLGEADLSLAVTVGQQIVAFDWVRVMTVRATIDHPTGDPTASPAPDTCEFVFDPNSDELVIDVRVKIEPDNADVREFFAEKLRYEIDPIADSHSGGSGGDVVMAWEHAWDSNTTMGKGVYVGGTWDSEVTFTGLPPSNSDFGGKTVTAQIRYGADVLWEGETEVEVFWPLLVNPASGRVDANFAKNRPGSDMNALQAVDFAGTTARDATRAPNWFYYWGEVVEGHDGIPRSHLRYADSLCSYGRTPAGRYFADGYSGRHDRLLIGEDAQSDDADPDGGGPRDETTGIDTFRDTVVHENYHAIDQLVTWTNSQFGLSISGATLVADTHWSAMISKPANTPTPPLGAGRVYNHYVDQNNDGDFLDPGEDLDTDGDGVPNAYDSPDTQIEPPAYDAEPDDENALARSDWGSPGKNHRTIDDASD